MAVNADVYLIERAIIALKRQLNELAHSALESPAHRDAYEYGRMVGNYAGLKQALSVIEGALSKENEDDDHGYERRGETRIIRS